MIDNYIYPVDAIGWPPSRSARDSSFIWIPNSARLDIHPIKRFCSGLNGQKRIPALQDKGFALFPDDRPTSFEFEVRSPVKGKDLHLVLGTAIRADDAVVTSDGLHISSAQVEFHYREAHLPGAAYAPWKLGYEGARSTTLSSWLLQYDGLRVPESYSSAKFQYDTPYQFKLTRQPSNQYDTLKGDMMLFSISATWYFQCDCEFNQILANGCQCGGS